MDLDNKDIDPFGHRPITSATARDVLSNPRWAYLLFELGVINNQDSSQTAGVLADRLELPPETVSEDLDSLADRDAVSVTSESPPRYRSEGSHFYAENWVELPDGERVDYIPKVMFGAIGYGYIDPTVQQIIDEYGYGKFHAAASIYEAAILDGEFDYSFEEMFPRIPHRDLAPVKQAYKYAYSRLSEDPLWGKTYDIEYTTEE